MDTHLALQSELSDVCGVQSLDKHKALVITCLAGAQEFMEAIDFFKDATKPWKQPSFDESEVKEELIDVYHFLLQAFNIMGMNEREIDSLYRMKRQKNFDRIMGKYAK